MKKVKFGNQEYHPEVILEKAKRIGNIFVIVGVISLINSVLVYLKSNVTFSIGLTVSQFINGFAQGIYNQSSGSMALILAGIINVALAGYFIFTGFQAKKEKMFWVNWAIFFYSIDTIILLPFKLWINFGIHLFFLLGMFGTLKLIIAKNEALAILSSKDEELENDDLLKVDEVKPVVILYTTHTL